jgi:hypothetical protein
MTTCRRIHDEDLPAQQFIPQQSCNNGEASGKEKSDESFEICGAHKIVHDEVLTITNHDYLCSSISSCKRLGLAPINRSTTSPCFRNKKVGMAETLYLAAAAGEKSRVVFVGGGKIERIA